MAELVRGGNRVIGTAATTVAVTGAARGVVDLFVFELGADQQVRTDDDLVFFNNPVSPDRAVSLAEDAVTVDLAAIPADIETVAVAVALDDSVDGSLADIEGLSVAVAQSGGVSLRLPAQGLTTERSAVLVELYRRGGSWKIRNRSAGWDDGLTALVQAHGVTVDDAPPRSVAGEETLSLVKREKLDLRKREVQKVLLTKGAVRPVGRVVLVMDNTGSMSSRYKSGQVGRIIERMVPVATQLDSDGRLEAYAYAERFVALPDVTVESVDTWVQTYVHLRGTHGGISFDAIGGANNEIPIMEEIIGSLNKGASEPTLVLFFTDGGFSAKTAITKLMRAASVLPAFWQFVGIGQSNFGILEKLDDLSDRIVDNAGFFAVDDVDALSDADLYGRLLGEYPDWLDAARAAGVLR